jgi:hypothetical protein
MGDDNTNTTVETRICNKCSEEKPKSDFYFGGKYPQYRSTCRKCMAHIGSENKMKKYVKRPTGFAKLTTEQQELFISTMKASSINSAQKAIGVSSTTGYAWVKTGQIPI